MDRDGIEVVAVVLAAVTAGLGWLATVGWQRAAVAEQRARTSRELAEAAQAAAKTWRSVAWINGQRVAVLERLLAARRRTVAALMGALRGE